MSWQTGMQHAIRCALAGGRAREAFGTAASGPRPGRPEAGAPVRPAPAPPAAAATSVVCSRPPVRVARAPTRSRTVTWRHSGSRRGASARRAWRHINMPRTRRSFSAYAVPLRRVRLQAPLAAAPGGLTRAHCALRHPSPPSTPSTWPVTKLGVGGGAAGPRAFAGGSGVRGMGQRPNATPGCPGSAAAPTTGRALTHAGGIVGWGGVEYVCGGGQKPAGPVPHLLEGSSRNSSAAATSSASPTRFSACIASDALSAWCVRGRRAVCVCMCEQGVRGVLSPGGRAWACHKRGQRVWGLEARARPGWARGKLRQDAVPEQGAPIDRHRSVPTRGAARAAGRGARTAALLVMRSASGVRVRPGATQLTRMPLGAYVAAADSIRPGNQCVCVCVEGGGAGDCVVMMGGGCVVGGKGGGERGGWSGVKVWCNPPSCTSRCTRQAASVERRSSWHPRVHGPSSLTHTHALPLSPLSSSSPPRSPFTPALAAAMASWFGMPCRATADEHSAMLPPPGWRIMALTAGRSTLKALNRLMRRVWGAWAGVWR